jgi:opacity protein-like surface antigen
LSGVSDRCFAHKLKAKQAEIPISLDRILKLSAHRGVKVLIRRERVSMRKFIFVSVAMCLLVGFAAAQVPTSGNVFLGYSFEHTDWTGLSSALSHPNLSGWEGSLEGKIFPHIGIVADLSGHYGSENFSPATVQPVGSSGGSINVTGHELEVLFGPRLSIPVGNFTPFAEAFFGVAHIHNGGDFPSSSNTSFGTALGGGLDYKIIRPIAVRVEADYLQTRFFNTTQNNLRFSTGVVVRF